MALEASVACGRAGPAITALPPTAAAPLPVVPAASVPPASVSPASPHWRSAVRLTATAAAAAMPNGAKARGGSVASTAAATVSILGPPAKRLRLAAAARGVARADDQAWDALQAHLANCALLQRWRLIAACIK